tara:strand:- start:51481 stop:52251 length:771 start_codon:yes stop_codon:yes gene_type:complete
MKTVILAGGLGSRLSEETDVKPKPMVEIGGKPILWHIMKIYSNFGLNDFIICLGYKGYIIKEYFLNYFIHNSDLKLDLQKNKITTINSPKENWKVTLVDTGEKTITGGRLKRVKKFLDKSDFCFTYGDGLSNVNISQLIKFHKSKKKLATVTAVKPPARFGALNITDDKVIKFKEKSQTSESYINGGFFVLSPKVLDLIKDDKTIWEREPLESLSKKNQLNAFKHNGFWHPMDTLRDKRHLEDLWINKKAPWKLWN